MYWTEFKHINLVFLFLTLLILTACSEQKSADKAIDNEKIQEESLSEEEKIIRQVESKLDITAAEKYDIQIQYRLIDPDTLKDALILVNRKEFGYQKAKNTETERFFESTGSTGLYNFVFLKRGGSDKLISTNPLGSNANYPLTAEFLELTSKAHKDFFVEYRVRNSLYRNYYTLRNEDMFLTFSCPVFDSIGALKPRVYDIQHLTSDVRISKDIALYEGKIVDYDIEEIENINAYEPKEIVRSGALYVYFIFNDKTMKYVTPMGVKEE
jgi:hypothetical protein